MMSSTKHCSVPCCGEKLGSMYLFPKDLTLREKWKSSCQIVRNVSNFMYVCYRHFSSADVLVSLTGKHRRLRKGAVPMLNLPESLRRKGRRNCIVHTCQSDESQDVTLHFFPKNPEIQRKWALVCKVPGNVSRNTRVCSRHFPEDDFVYSRGHGIQAKILKSGVIPSRNLPVSFPSRHKSKQWSVSSTFYEEENEVTFDINNECSPRESEDAWIQRFIYEDQ